MPPRTARTTATRGKELEPKPGDGPGILDWPFVVAQGEARMASS